MIDGPGGLGAVESTGLPAVLARVAEIRGSAAPAAAPPADSATFSLPDPAKTLNAAALASAQPGLGAGQAAAELTSLRAAQGYGTGPSVHPLGGAGEVIGRPNAGTHTLGNWQSDNAIDLRAPEGTPVYAVADGVIGDRIGPLSSTESRFAGQRLTLESPGDAFYYAHLSDIVVGPGQPVVRGQLLGYSGSANGVPHLHFGQREGDPVATFVEGS